MSVRHIDDSVDSDSDSLYYDEALPQARSAEISLSEPSSFAEQLPYLVLALYPTMFKIPDLPGIPNFLGPMFLEVLSSAPLVAIILLNLILGRGKINRHQVPFLLACILFLGLQVISLVRYVVVDDSHQTESVRMALGFSLIATASFSFAWNASGDVLQRLVGAATHGLFFYLLCNILLYLVGVRAQDTYALSHEVDGIIGKNAILSAIGIGGNRVRFPMATGINSFGVLSGAALLLGMFRYQQSRLYGSMVIIVGMVATVMTDTRSALVFAFAGLIYSIMLNSRYRNQLVHLALVMPFLSFIAFPLITLATPLLEKTGLAESVFRASSDREKGNTRMSVYRVVYERAIEDPENIAFGYGYMGHKTSGASFAYSAFLADREDRVNSRRTPHNGILSMFIDHGLLGVTAFLALTASMIRSLMSQPGIDRRHAMGLLAYILLCGATEAVPTLYFFDMLWVFLLLLAGTLAIGTDSQSRYILTELDHEAD